MGERQPLVKDNLRWKMSFGGRRRTVEEDLWWKTTFGGTPLLVVTPPLDNHSQTQPKNDNPCMLPYGIFSSVIGIGILVVGQGGLGLSL